MRSLCVKLALAGCCRPGQAVTLEAKDSMTLILHMSVLQLAAVPSFGLVFDTKLNVWPQAEGPGPHLYEVNTNASNKDSKLGTAC